MAPPRGMRTISFRGVRNHRWNSSAVEGTVLPLGHALHHGVGDGGDGLLGHITPGRGVLLDTAGGGCAMLPATGSPSGAATAPRQPRLRTLRTPRTATRPPSGPSTRRP